MIDSASALILAGSGARRLTVIRVADRSDRCRDALQREGLGELCRRILARARTFATLIKTAYDLHRLDLYPALGAPLPTTREAEAGRALTALVQRGASHGIIDRSRHGT